MKGAVGMIPYNFIMQLMVVLCQYYHSSLIIIFAVPTKMKFTDFIKGSSECQGKLF